MKTSKMTTPLLGLVVATSAITALSLSSSAPADGGIASDWQDAYPLSASYDNASCFLCHASGSFGSNFNSYGQDMLDLLDGGASLSQAFAMTESMDSDEDPTGSTNLEEIDADTQPGWTPGPNNTTYTDGSPNLNEEPPASVDGDLDPTPISCTGDIDGNGSVGFSDLTLLLNGWGPCPAPPASCDADLDVNGSVGFSDLTILLNSWGECP